MNIAYGVSTILFHLSTTILLFFIAILALASGLALLEDPPAEYNRFQTRFWNFLVVLFVMMVWLFCAGAVIRVWL
jgi:hypothetical protein